MVMERCIQKIIGTNEEVIALEKEFEALEAAMGNVPSKRRYWAWYAPLPAGTMVWEREWESLAALEAYNQKTNGPEWVALLKKANQVFTDFHFEIYGSMDLG